MRAPFISFARRTARCGALLTLLASLALPSDASAQTASDVLSFLLINRSVQTGDFARDEAAAAATSDAFRQFVVAELGTVPVSSSAGGFVFRLDPALGVSVRASESFGPFYSERAITSGAGVLSISVNYQSSSYADADGRSLRNGSLVSTAARLQGESAPFDAETLTLKLRTDRMTVFGNYGINDRLDIGAALPVIHLDMSGTRIDTYRGTSVTQATGATTAVGVGDLILRGKFNLLGSRANSVALAGEARVPTGDEANLLGAGEAAVTPRVIGSWDGGRVGVHGNFGMVFSAGARDLDYRAATTVTVTPRLTLVGEVTGRYLESIGRLAQVETPHPTLQGVQTIRLTTTSESTQRLNALAGLKWNIARSLLVGANALIPLTDSGLTTTWTPTVSLDYTFGR